MSKKKESLVLLTVTSSRHTRISVPAFCPAGCSLFAPVPCLHLGSGIKRAPAHSPLVVQPKPNPTNMRVKVVGSQGTNQVVTCGGATSWAGPGLHCRPWCACTAVWPVSSLWVSYIHDCGAAAGRVDVCQLRQHGTQLECTACLCRACRTALARDAWYGLPRAAVWSLKS